MIYEFDKLEKIIFGIYMIYLSIMNRDYRYVKSRFSRKSLIMGYPSAIKALADMLRKIEDIDLTGMPLVPSKYRYGTSFCILEDEKTVFLYEFEYSFGDPDVFAFVIAHEIRHFIQYRNDYIDFGPDGLECKVTKIKHKVGSKSLPLGLKYSQLPWESDANWFAFQLVNIPLDKKLAHFHTEEFFKDSFENCMRWY